MENTKLGNIRYNYLSSVGADKLISDLIESILKLS